MRFQDIQISDVELKKNFLINWGNGQYQKAFDILQNNPQLDSKKFTQEVFNNLFVILQELEIKFHEDFINSLNIELNNFNEAIHNFIDRLDWNETTEYKIGNFVNDNNNEIFLCVKECVNIPTSNNNYWIKMGLFGKDGAEGFNLNLKYHWQNNLNYSANDLVVYNDYFWISKNSNINSEPSKLSNDWEAFLLIPRTKIIVSRNAPSSIYNGMVWMKILV